ncbi:hypothetical protein AMAG_06141 [Allomyces macrogynus ATCC 38327]|uniref:N-terminal Ras-GEF domain-containing protein n=1 Tax=Allomyces macrogynus (strain ATCC 38327) TaxID=578462 RepID=A0A0L0SEG8_ALLM3|nr:hypothetical protein AMAG_06141 [Allomyces macrogynus ATCC 38327]|eukprot:KNE60785.1 hypothetical protein AMAG_06141 [Allomyces macrogynus ATCC 38327]
MSCAGAEPNSTTQGGPPPRYASPSRLLMRGSGASGSLGNLLSLRSPRRDGSERSLGSTDTRASRLELTSEGVFAYLGLEGISGLLTGPGICKSAPDFVEWYANVLSELKDPFLVALPPHDNSDAHSAQDVGDGLAHSFLGPPSTTLRDALCAAHAHLGVPPPPPTTLAAAAPAPPSMDDVEALTLDVDRVLLSPNRDDDDASTTASVTAHLADLLVNGAAPPTSPAGLAKPSSPLRARTHQDLTDDHILRLLITHRAYLAPSVLLRTLTTAFLEPPTTDRQLQNVVRRTIERILRAWINHLYDDLVLDHAVPFLTKFADHLESLVDGAHAYDGTCHRVGCGLAALLQLKRQSTLIGRLRNLSRPATAPSSLSPTKSPTGGGVKAHVLAHFVDTGDVAHAADVIARCDRAAVAALSVPALDAFVRGQKERFPPTHALMAPIREYLQLSTGLFHWTLSVLESGPTTRRRIATLKLVLKLATALRERGDWNGAMVVGAAAVHPWCMFQRAVWEGVSAKYINMAREILGLIDPAGRYSNYFDALQDPVDSSNGSSTLAPIPCVVIHILVAMYLATDATTPDSADPWMDVYHPLLLAASATSATSATTPVAPASAETAAFLSTLRAFDPHAAWKRDIRLATPDDLDTFIAAITATPGGGGSPRRGSAGNGGLLKSLSGSVAHLLGASGASRKHFTASPTAASTVAAGAGLAPAGMSAKSDHTKEAPRGTAWDADAVFGLSDVLVPNSPLSIGALEAAVGGLAVEEEKGEEEGR